MANQNNLRFQTPSVALTSREDTIMAHQTDNGTAAAARPVSYYLTPGPGRTWLDAQNRYDELTQRDLSVRARAILEARGEYDPAKHGTSNPEPLTLTEHLEVLANGEVVARVYRHPAQVDRALQAGAAREQIADACGCSEAKARQDYREWAEGPALALDGRVGRGRRAVRPG